MYSPFVLFIFSGTSIKFPTSQQCLAVETKIIRNAVIPLEFRVAGDYRSSLISALTEVVRFRIKVLF